MGSVGFPLSIQTALSRGESRSKVNSELYIERIVVFRMAAPKTTFWSVVLKLRGRPQCPGCGVPLQQDAMSIKSDWAWCSICAFRGYAMDEIWKAIMRGNEYSNHLMISKGVTFVVPRWRVYCGVGMLNWTEVSKAKLPNE